MERVSSLEALSANSLGSVAKTPGWPGLDRRDVTGPDVARAGPSASLLTLPPATDSNFGTVELVMRQD